MTIDELAADGWRVQKAASVCPKKNDGWQSVLLLKNKHNQQAIAWGRMGHYTEPVLVKK